VVGGGLLVVLLPGFWLEVLYSSRFTPAAEFLAVFVVAEVVTLLAGVYSALLIGLDDIRGYVALAVGGNVVAIGLTLALAGPLGPLGVGLAFLGGNLVVLVLAIVRLDRRHAAGASLRSLRVMLYGLGVLGAAGAWAAGPEAPALGWRALAYVVAGGGFFMLLTHDERRWVIAPWTRP
jgi:O-antigen/teichoic acid export membrane protein